MKRIAIFVILVTLAVAAFAQQSLPEVLLRTSGSLSSGDTVASSGEYRDTYSVTVPDSGRIDVIAVSPDFIPTVTVSMPGGADRTSSSSSNAARVSVAVSAGVRVNVAIAGVSSQRAGGPQRYADYMLAVSFSQGGGDLYVGASVGGELTSDDETNSDGSYIDWYDVQLEPGQRIRVSLESDAFDTYLRVELPDGRTLENDDVDEGTNSGLAFSTTGGGVARIGATSFDYQVVGDYTISVDAADTAAFGVGQTITESLQGDSMQFDLVGDPGQSVSVELRSDDFDAYLEVEDTDGNYVSNDDADDSSDSRVTYTFGDSGTATITVSSYDGSAGTFSLSATPFTYDGPVIDDGFALHDGDVIDGQLNPGLPSPYGSPAQRFTFQGTSGTRIELLLSSDEIDSYLTVETPSGNTFTDDDSGGGYDSRLSIILDETGTYSVYASDLNNNPIGAYELSFEVLGTATAIYDADGELTTGDQTDITGKYYDLHSFGVKSGDTITVDVTSDDFDGYAIVRTPDGQILYRDDDTGGDGNPRIEFSADRTETLQLIVTTYDPEEMGAYHVSVYR